MYICRHSAATARDIMSGLSLYSTLIYSDQYSNADPGSGRVPANLTGQASRDTMSQRKSDQE